MMPNRRIIVSGGICVAFLVVVFFSSRLSLDTSFLDFPNPKTALDNWRKPISNVPKLAGPLSPGIYDMFEQRFSDVIHEDYSLYEIERICSQAISKPNIYLQCDIMGAGMTTLLSSIKTCLYTSLVLGTSIAMPTTPLRNQEHLDEWDQVQMPLGEWIDRDFLIQRISAICPKVNFALLDKRKQPNIKTIAKLNYNPCQGGVDEICSPFGLYGVDHDKKLWKPRFEAFFGSVSQLYPQAQGNVIVEMISTGMMHNKSSDASVERGFYEIVHLLRSVPKIRKIITKITDSMSSKPGQLLPFYGVHFRAEQDAVDQVVNGWTSPEDQLKNTLHYVQRAQSILGPDETTNLIYLACGDQEQIELFRDSARSIGYEVIDKWSIASSISSQLVKDINDLDFDHMAAIDFAMLLVSNFFIGTGHSAFSYNIAHDRSPTGRFLGNVLDLDEITLSQNPAIAHTRTQLFHPAGIADSYQSCL